MTKKEHTCAHILFSLVTSLLLINLLVSKLLSQRLHNFLVAFLVSYYICCYYKESGIENMWGETAGKYFPVVTSFIEKYDSKAERSIQKNRSLSFSSLTFSQYILLYEHNAVWLDYSTSSGKRRYSEQSLNRHNGGMEFKWSVYMHRA